MPNLCAVNVRIDPHSNDLYLNLFRETALSNNVVSLPCLDKNGFRQQAAIGAFDISTYFNIEKFRGSAVIRGALYLWKMKEIRQLTISGNEEIDESGEYRIVSDIEPNDAVEFAFVADGHRLIAPTVTQHGSDIHPELLKYIFSELFEYSAIYDEYGVVSLTVEASKESVEEILAIPNLHYLEIMIDQPNADLDAELEQAIAKRIREEHAKRIRETVESDGRQGIMPNECTKKRAEIARSNGAVRGCGIESSGARIEKSTDQHPWIWEYDEDRSLGEVALEFVERLVNFAREGVS